VLQGLLKLVLGASVRTHCAQNKSPDDPVVGVAWTVLDSTLYFLDGLSHVALLEKGKCPVAKTVDGGYSIWTIEFCCVAYVDGLLVVLVHVVDESQVVVGIGMLAVYLNANLKVLHCHWVALLFEVSQPKVILHLSIVSFKLARALEGKTRLVEELHFVEADAQKEVAAS